jgi:erythritol kinase (D-erythritol 1-phosphate-forming)
MATTIVLGVDAGTTAVKAVATATDGRVLGQARTAVQVDRPTHLAAEQNMDELWEAVARTAHAALAEAGAVEVAAICVTGQGDGAWLIDADGRPLGPAAIWLDGRAGSRVEDWRIDGRGAAVRATTGSALFPGALPVLLEEVEERDPALIARAVTHLNCKDWIRYRLTGTIATDASEASRTYLDVRTGQYSEDLVGKLGHERFRHLLPPILSPTAIAGRVDAAGANAFGVPAGTPVATGMVDTAASGVGLGVLRPGDSYAIIGTTAFAGALQPGVTLGDDVPAITLALGGGQVIECLAPMNGTPNLDWAREVTGCGHLAWSDVESMVHTAGSGAGGVLYLPYAAISGERAPFVDGAASAAWLGLSVRTTRAQLVRAAYEGIALALRECMDLLDIGESVRLCGGAAASRVVCQVLADVTGRTVVRSTADEPGARGACALAMVAAGLAPDLTSVLGSWDEDVETAEPDPASRALHDRRYATFTAVRDVLRASWPALRDLRLTGSDPSDIARSSQCSSLPVLTSW